MSSFKTRHFLFWRLCPKSSRTKSGPSDVTLIGTAAPAALGLSGAYPNRLSVPLRAEERPLCDTCVRQGAAGTVDKSGPLSVVKEQREEGATSTRTTPLTPPGTY